MAGKGGGGVVFLDEAKGKRGMRIENPFTLKLGQVFTGFGVGCGIGIGVGRPLNLGAIPVLNQIMAATRGATDAFSGVQRPLNNAIRKLGAKNIEAGIGCGVGFGHGFGVVKLLELNTSNAAMHIGSQRKRPFCIITRVMLRTSDPLDPNLIGNILGLAVKPGFLHQIQSNLFEMAGHAMIKLGINTTSTLSVDQHIFPAPIQTDRGIVKELVAEGSTGSVIPQSVKSITTSGENIKDGKTVVSETLAPEKYKTRAEEVLNNFLENSLLKEESNPVHKQGGQLQLENIVLEMVLKHQVLLEELKQENDKLRQILVEKLKVHPTELVASSTYKSKPACNECFECRRRQRKR